MNRAEARRWSRIVGREADALEATLPPPVVAREMVQRIAVRISLADELDEVDDLLQQFAAVVKEAEARSKALPRP